MLRSVSLLGCAVVLIANLSAIEAAGTLSLTDEDPAPVDLTALSRESEGQVQRLQRSLAQMRASGAAVSTSVLDELALWRQIQLVISQRESLREAETLALAGVATDPREDRKIARFMDLEEARETLEVTEENLNALEIDLQAERLRVLDSKDLLQQAQQDRRRTIENALGSSGGSAVMDMQRRIDSLRVRLLEQQLALQRERVEEMNGRVAETESVIQHHRDRITRADKRIRLTKEEVEQQLSRLRGMEQTVRNHLAELDEQMHVALVASSESNDQAVSADLEVIREESQLLHQLLNEFAEIRECWKRRYRYSHQRVDEELWVTWLEEAREAKTRLSQIQERLENRALQRRQQVAAIRGRLQPEDTATQNGLARVSQLETIIDAYGNLQILAARGQRLYGRFVEDLEARHDRYSIWRWTSWAANRVQACWRYELTTVDDRSITVGKLVMAFLLLIVGVAISKWVSSMIAFRVLPRFGFSHAAATTIRQMMMYALIVAMTMLSLNMVKVPLTIFAFLGGAAAIGVGFGSQNTVANFISGLILLIQRPIRIGDLIHTDGIDANVEHIGARATRVRTTENVEVLIPNSNILQNSVTNWTLSDTQIRTSVTVGVAYGSPVRTVTESLREVVDQHPKVLCEPEPIVLFEDFGDSSLVFKIHFWIHMSTMMDGAIVRSDVRLAIDDEFRKRDIVIAFPQRDVHLDLQTPVEVALTDTQRSMPRTPRRAA